MPTRSRRVATRWTKSAVVAVCAGLSTAPTLSTVMSVPPCMSERVPGGVVLLAEAPDREAEALAVRHVERRRDRGRVAVPDVMAGPGRVGVREVHLLAGRVAHRLRAGRGQQALEVVVAHGRGR